MVVRMKFFSLYGKSVIYGVVLLLGALDIILWQRVFLEERKPDIAMYVFDVGQGDSIFLDAKDGTRILVDGGPNDRVLAPLGKHMSFFDRSIDAIILTHPHADHITGLIEVLKRYRVGMIIENGVSYHTAEAKEFEDIVSKQKLQRIIINHPMILKFADGAVLRFLTPTHSYERSTLKNIHDAMLVSELDYEGKKILLMGDAEKNIEDDLVARGVVGPVDVLKAGHHGSKTSSNTEFLNTVKPKYAIVSVGRHNRYGHPNYEALLRLAISGAKIFRTDINGMIAIVINHGALLLEHEK